MAILTVVMLTGYDDNSSDGECLAGWASINCLTLLYNAKDAASFYSGWWNTGTNLDLAFASVGPNSRLLDRRVLDKFPRSHHRPLLITRPRFAMAVPSMPVNPITTGGRKLPALLKCCMVLKNYLHEFFQIL